MLGVWFTKGRLWTDEYWGEFSQISQVNKTSDCELHNKHMNLLKINNA
jgi:hypothetical protein